MGDSADMILEGILCEICGEYIGEEVGYPRTCTGCSPAEDVAVKIKSEETLKRRNRQQRRRKIK